MEFQRVVNMQVHCLPGSWSQDVDLDCVKLFLSSNEGVFLLTKNLPKKSADMSCPGGSFSGCAK